MGWGFVVTDDDRSDELLVLMPAGSAGIESLREQYAVRHVFSPRLGVVVASEDEETTLRRRDDVRMASRGPLPDDVLDELDPSELALARGWSMRDEMRRKRRPGEGEPWDAPGRLPPDLPPNSQRGDRRPPS